MDGYYVLDFLWVLAYLGGVGCSDGLAGVQSQLADVFFLAADDEVAHDEDEGAGQALAGRQGRADRRQPIAGCRRIVRHFTQNGQSDAELTVPGGEGEGQGWAGLRGGRKMREYLSANISHSTGSRNFAHAHSYLHQGP